MTEYERNTIKNMVAGTSDEEALIMLNALFERLVGMEIPELYRFEFEDNSSIFITGHDNMTSFINTDPFATNCTNICTVEVGENGMFYCSKNLYTEQREKMKTKTTIVKRQIANPNIGVLCDESLDLFTSRVQSMANILSNNKSATISYPDQNTAIISYEA